MTDDEKFVGEKFVEMILVFLSFFFLILLGPIILDHFYEKRTLRERVVDLEKRISDLEYDLDKRISDLEYGFYKEV
jgi:hypothetical protein